MNGDRKLDSGLGQAERELLARITTQIDQMSAYQHQLARRGRVLRDSATQLRLGRKSQEVLAQIQAQIPDAVRVMESLAE